MAITWICVLMHSLVHTSEGSIDILIVIWSDMGMIEGCIEVAKYGRILCLYLDLVQHLCPYDSAILVYLIEVPVGELRL